jgi:hypothetical protein
MRSALRLGRYQNDFDKVIRFNLSMFCRNDIHASSENCTFGNAAFSLEYGALCRVVPFGPHPFSRSKLKFLRFYFLLKQHCRADRYQTWKDDMRTYICTFPRMRSLKFCAAFAIVAAGLPLLAQNGRSNGSSAQAELHITAIVAPVIIPPRHDRHRDRDEGIVSYSLTPQEQQLSVTEEVRTMLVNVNGGAAQQPVELTTIVVQ